MKPIIFITAAMFLAGCNPLNEILGGMHMHTPGRSQELSLKFLGLDLTQQAAVDDISALNQFP